jgi:hypothetical protein
MWLSSTQISTATACLTSPSSSGASRCGAFPCASPCPRACASPCCPLSRRYEPPAGQAKWQTCNLALPGYSVFLACCQRLQMPRQLAAIEPAQECAQQVALCGLIELYADLHGTSGTKWRQTRGGHRIKPNSRLMSCHLLCK